MRRNLRFPFILVVGLAASLVGLAAPAPTAAAADPPVIAAAGDIACAPPGTRTSKKCHQGDTAALLTTVDRVLPLGDEQYECGQLSAFNQVYEASWGAPALKSKSHPIVGDNEYAGDGCQTAGASGYFTYFGDSADPQPPNPCTANCKGYYSYDIPTGAANWHVVALNSECTQPGVGGCGASSPQVRWLKDDLAAHPDTCTLAYFHRPYFSDKGGTVAKVKQLFRALYDGGADVLLVGHQHIYERFRLQNPSGGFDPNGIRQFIVGTGGKSTTALAASPPVGWEARNTGTFGVLKLTLHPTSYDWQFDDEANASKPYSDSGSQDCH